MSLIFLMWKLVFNSNSLKLRRQNSDVFESVLQEYNLILRSNSLIKYKGSASYFL